MQGRGRDSGPPKVKNPYKPKAPSVAQRVACRPPALATPVGEISLRWQQGTLTVRLQLAATGCALLWGQLHADAFDTPGLSTRAAELAVLDPLRVSDVLKMGHIPDIVVVGA